MTANAPVYGASPVKRGRRTNAELDTLDDAILAAVAEDYPVSLRGVYYRCVSRGAVPKTEDAYKAVGRQLLKLRRSGRLPYDRITDGTRWVRKPDTYSDLDSALAEWASVYRRALWHTQDVAVYAFTEKDAISGGLFRSRSDQDRQRHRCGSGHDPPRRVRLVNKPPGVLDPVVDRWDVPLGVLRGYASETFLHEMAAAINVTGCPSYVYQLGDHDPSGVGAWEHFQRKVLGFLPAGFPVTFERLAVTPAQIVAWNLPTRPTKRSDTRAHNFVGESVEVDAIPANLLRNLLEDAIVRHVDEDAYRVTLAAEESERDGLWRLAGGDAL